MKRNEVLNKLKEYQVDDLHTKGGNVWAYVYDSGIHEAEKVAMEAYKLYMDHNGLDFTVFPSLLRLENEIIGEVAALFSEDPETIAGTFTSGGTESIILAVKAARDYAREQKPLAEQPEIILPNTAHAAFYKAAHYLGIKTVIVQVDHTSYKVDPKDVKNKITDNTIMIVGSSVNYSHGVSDPIEELGKIADQHDLWLHVDACIGGFLLAYFKQLGHPINEFDFSVLGVSSLSVDLHKYAYTPKGASVVLYRNKELRKHQFYTCTNWTGYPVINTTIQSTKSGGPLAACWATMQYIGGEGYTKLARKVWSAKEQMIENIKQNEDLYILGEPESSLLAIGSSTVDIYQLADVMRKSGWYIQIQPENNGIEPSIHLTITAVSKSRIEEFFEGLSQAIKEIKENPRISIIPQVTSMLANGPSEINTESMSGLMRMVGVDEDGNLPDQMAEINELLSILPHEVTREAFLNITNNLFTSTLIKDK